MDRNKAILTLMDKKSSPEDRKKSWEYKLE